MSPFNVKEEGTDISAKILLFSQNHLIGVKLPIEGLKQRLHAFLVRRPTEPPTFRVQTNNYQRLFRMVAVYLVARRE